MGLMASLVGPFVIANVDKIRAKTELKEVEHTLRYGGAIAFAQNRVITIKLSANQLSIYSDSARIKTIVFDSISFREDSFDISRSGLTDKDEITYELTGEAARLDVSSLINGKKL
ncbi:hypothetical protein PALB_11850 [Pseudoalteromonas luteoviolacea B = ATCC 29581]|nr:hypothetical protein PALB_11850 [Pseudoalteromonas luteoviolacea B = ATCC 29581]